ncbi:MAG: hypothetical protein IPN88_16825 [Bacteroidetes bacterium]|nr:hypothetical protein [Bacteroidota bacterium]
MANNFKQAIVRYLVLLLVLFSFTGYSQKISKHYSSALQQNGTLYFIFEQNDFSCNSSDFKYDLTYLSSGDSITMNFSIFDQSNIEIDSIRLVKDTCNLSAKADRIFIEPKKNKWHGRFTTKFLFADLEKFYGEGIPEIILMQKRRNGFTISKGAWKKQAELVNKIFMVIKYNK